MPYFFQKSIRWQILDSKSLWDRLHRSEIRKFGPHNLEYLSAPKKSDLVLIVGTLQYILDNQRQSLRDICDATMAESVIISRTPFLDQTLELVVEQRAILFDSIGSSNEGFVLVNLRNVNSVIEEICGLKYQLVYKSRKYPFELATRNGKIITFYQDLFFTRCDSDSTDFF